jgi:hypothetical protein
MTYTDSKQLLLQVNDMIGFQGLGLSLQTAHEWLLL